MIAVDELDLVLVQVPQTGCTAVAAEMVEHYGGRHVLRKHATLDDYIRFAGRVPALVVASVRDPVDQAVSSYAKARRQFAGAATGSGRGSLSLLGSTPHERAAAAREFEFSAWFCRFYRHVHGSKWLDSQRRAEHVLRFEHLSESFEALLCSLGVTPVRKLPRRNVTEGRSAGSPAELYDERARRRARWVFGPFMAEWGYELPSSWSLDPLRGSARVSAQLAYRVVPELRRARDRNRRRT